MKKILTTILAMALGVTAWGAVAKVGTTEYDTIDEAVAAWTSGTTLTLLADVQLTTPITVTEKVTLDLSTFTLSAPSGNKHAIIVAGSGNANLTVNADNERPGHIKSNSTTATQYFGCTSACIYANYADCAAKKTITINNGVFDGACLFNQRTSGEKGTPLAVTINGGTFNADINAYRCYYLTINGGTFNKFTGSYAYQTTTCKSYYYGGRYKSTLTTSSGSSRAYYYGSVDIQTATKTDFYYIDADGYYVLTKGKSFLPSNYEAVANGYRCANANAAIETFATIALNENIAATASKTVSSGTLTIDASAEGASYTGNVTLTGKSGSFVVKFNEAVGYYGSVTATMSGYHLHLAETIANGIVTRTYTVKKDTALTEANSEAVIGSTYYETVYDAFYAVDGNTEGKTIKLLKDVTNASILTNGKAVNEEGKTDVIFDLNGHSFTLQSAGTGNQADYTLTVIDSSEGKTGEVMNNTLSLLKIALTGDNDFSGKYTLKIQGGTWHFDPSAVSVTDETHNLVDEGYSAVSLGNGKWIVGQVTVETGDLEPDAPIEDTTTEVSYTIETVQKIGETVLDSKADQVISVSVSQDDIGGTKLTSVKLNDVVADSVAAMGMDAVNVTKVEILVAADSISAGAQTVSYSVKPEAIVTVVNGTDTSTSTIELSNNDLAAGASFTFDLDVTALGVADGAWVKVIHVSSDYPEETNLYKAKTVGGKKVVTVTTSHFSTFSASPADTEGADAVLLPSVTNTIVSANCFGAISITDSEAATAFVAVPFGAFGVGDSQIAAADVVQAASLSEGDKMYVWNGAAGAEQKYEVYKVDANGTWVVDDKKVTVAADGTVTVGSESPDSVTVPTGTGVFIERKDATKPIFVYGQVLTNTVAETTFASGLTLVSPPSTNAMASVNLNALTWSGVSDITTTNTTSGMTIVKSYKDADFIYYRNAANAIVRYYHCNEKWGTVIGTWKEAEAVIPAGTAFWYSKNGGGETKVTW